MPKNERKKDLRVCLECGEKLTGRIGKKFCSAICRSRNHRELNGSSVSPCEPVNKVLRKNRGILKRLALIKGVEIDILLELGFDFNFFTGRIFEKGEALIMVYEYAYKVNQDKKIEIKYMGLGPR